MYYSYKEILKARQIQQNTPKLDYVLHGMQCTYVGPRKKSWEICYCVKGVISLKLQIVSNTNIQQPLLHA